jgi:CheY-like chemotaxis protein
VLLVEDDPDVRAARRMLLESEGYRVEAVASLEQALEAARRAGSFDAIVTDDPLPIEPLAALLGRPLKGVLVTDDPPRTGNALLRSDVTMRVTRGALRAEDLLLPLRELIGERTGPAASVGGGDAAALIVHELRSSLAVISNVLETCRPRRSRPGCRTPGRFSGGRSGRSRAWPTTCSRLRRAAGCSACSAASRSVSHG